MLQDHTLGLKLLLRGRQGIENAKRITRRAPVDTLSTVAASLCLPGKKARWSLFFVQLVIATGASIEKRSMVCLLSISIALAIHRDHSEAATCLR
ncbi:unnamed protein product [Arabidopsis thaliana]|uniref:(thale cress) hypothetical protein n=1 Tax=Arabidopsis thaliana TaxID=3702 RepID=A0A7G2EBI3_ARATH|nr:unnamed protein product [Arabidopsis thaliana]